MERARYRINIRTLVAGGQLWSPEHKQELKECLLHMRLENQVNNYAPITTHTPSKLDFLCTLAVQGPTQMKKITSSRPF